MKILTFATMATFNPCILPKQEKWGYTAHSPPGNFIF
jgi:hypothetical protein